MPQYTRLLSELLGALIANQLDCTSTEDEELQHWLSLQIAYLYGYVRELQDCAFADLLLYENRQYHYDVRSGMSYITLPFVDHQRKVREALRMGTQTLQVCSAAHEDEDLLSGTADARLQASLPKAVTENGSYSTKTTKE